MPRKLNDKQVLELVAEHANGTSISKLAKKYKIDWTTCKRYIESSREMQEEIQAIKNESVTEWLKAQKGTIMGILDQIIGLLPKRLKDASVKDLMGAYKILTETSINNVEGKGDGSNEGDEKGITFIFTDTGTEGKNE